jgi:hypothetical protein
MITHMLTILQMTLDSLRHAWPNLLITVPLAVAVNMTGASKYIKHGSANKTHNCDYAGNISWGG